MHRSRPRSMRSISRCRRRSSRTGRLLRFISRTSSSSSIISSSMSLRAPRRPGRAQAAGGVSNTHLSLWPLLTLLTHIKEPISAARWTLGGFSSRIAYTASALCTYCRQLRRRAVALSALSRQEA